jgi:ATP-dependent DNA helicase RecQ
MSFAPKCLCLDIETAADDALDVRKIAAWRPDTHGQVVVANVAKAHNIAEQLDALTEGASFVVGHNMLRHDIPALRQRFPQLKLLALPIVDTLELSPISFPQNPYHSLVKDYKLVRDARSDPLKDAQLALKLWQDQFDAFKAQSTWQEIG